jgi:hypothetical protein
MFMKYCAAMVYIEVELPSGDRNIGSAFHVGEGVFVTARHVVEGNTILQVASTDWTYIPLAGEEAKDARVFVLKEGNEVPSHWVRNEVLEIDRDPFFHANDQVDVAVFRVQQIDPYTPIVVLGSHLDDWIGHGDFVLSEAIVLGYPPVPMTREPILVGARAEVNAVVDLYDTAHVHFILSSMPRGGFSGGVAVSEYGFALGVVTRSLTSNYSPVEMGFMSIIGVEPIYDCLAEHLLLPDIQAQQWDEYFRSTGLRFRHSQVAPDVGDFVTAASITVYKDNKNYSIEITCAHDPILLESAADAAASILSRFECIRSRVRSDTVRFNIALESNETPIVVDAGRAVSASLIGNGYEPIPPFSKDNPLLPLRS